MRQRPTADRAWRFERSSACWIYIEKGIQILGCVRLVGRHSKALVYPNGELPRTVADEVRSDQAKRAVEDWWNQTDLEVSGRPAVSH